MHHVEVKSLRKKRVEDQGSDNRAWLQTADPQTNINWRKENPREFFSDEQWERGSHTPNLKSSSLDQRVIKIHLEDCIQFSPPAQQEEEMRVTLGTQVNQALQYRSSISERENAAEEERKPQGGLLVEEWKLCVYPQDLLCIPSLLGFCPKPFLSDAGSHHLASWGWIAPAARLSSPSWSTPSAERPSV